MGQVPSLGRNRLAGWARLLAAVTSAYGVVALLGWLLNWPALTSFGVGAARTSVMTAICLLLCGGVILAYTSQRLPTPVRVWTVRLCAAAVLFIALGAFTGYLLRQPDAGYLLGRGYGNVSSATALSFIALSVALLMLCARFYWTSAFLCALGLIICETAIVSYVFDVRALANVSFFSTMSLPTGLSLALLFQSAMLLEPDSSWVRYLTRGSQARLAFWLLMPASVLVPLSTTSIVVALVRFDHIQPAFGFALLAVVTTVLLAIIVVLSCVWLDRKDRENARLVAIIACSDDAIVGKTPDGVITSWNKGAEKLFGFSAEEAIGHTMHIVVPDDRLDEEDAILAKIRGNEPVEHFETLRRRKDGSTIAVSVSVAPMRLADGEIVGASSITRDISEAKRRASELRRSNAELEQFAYIASHDLQEPLRMVANYVELLADRYRGQLDEKADKYIHFAVDGARRMQQLVTDLLAYSRVGTQGKPLVPVDSALIVRHVRSALGGVIEASGAQVDVGELPLVEGDEVQLSQLFQNLIGNAIKFRGEAAPLVRISAEREGHAWRFTVSDNGIGMDMRYADRIFQMFQRLAERGKYEGSGIGLAIAKRIVERHEGEIWAESELGRGTCFHFTLRACPDGLARRHSQVAA